jgi:hypothetical protein
MTQTIEQSDAAIRNTFYNMEEGVDYVLNDFWFAETNRLRKEYDYALLKDKRKYKFTRKGDQLFVNNNPVFNFDGKSNLALSFARAYFVYVAFSLALVVALQHNGLEKLNKNTCDGKVVEIDGKKYKLTAV